MAERGSGIPVVVAGLGDVGRAIARSVLETPELRLVAAGDPAPGLAGGKLESILNVPCPDLTVASDLAVAFAAARGGVLLQATHSSFEAVRPQIEQAVRAGLSVASTCEELAYPFKKHPEISEHLDSEAKEWGVAIVGTGVNPGFVMDKLVLTLAAVSQRVDSAKAVRIVDASKRRMPLQKKIGAGMTVEEFKAKVA